MSDFLDRFGDQLHAAEQRHAVAARAPDVPAHGRRSRRVRLAAVALAGAVLVAAPAAAIIAPWEPSLERAGVDDPVAVEHAPVAVQAVEAFAVLRRPQNDTDRRLAAPVLTAVGAGNQVDRVQTHGIRAVAPGWAVVPAKAMKTTPAAHADEDVLCLTNGDVIGCSASDRAATTGIQLTTASEGQTTIAGLVPDRVSGVRFVRAEGGSVEADVASNFFAVSVRKAGSQRTIKAPPGYEHGSRIPAPPTPATGTLEWLDDDRNVIGRSAIGA